MQQNLSKKICLLVDCLSRGGAEKAASKLSIELDRLGYNVFIITLLDEVDYRYAGELVNLGKNHSGIRIVKLLQKSFGLKTAIKNIKPDAVIDYRMRNRWFMEFVLYWLVLKNQKMIYRINSYKVDWHIPNGKFFRNVYRKSKVVAVSNAIKTYLQDVYGMQEVDYIPNFLSTMKN